ncbi:hypothetical protein KK137_04340 [Croceibacterium sp. LX-88]|uniref:Uncharacterized protein n=1 Tax=Croceibacterium selenioxidans TaxID=2838833 RepID=A0ABS5W2Q5_9SPHN|nr:hypothetical protein [Croceibacterium selenioxidans]MBT2133558.1 hypothetical protein [Croceibacterium selenioxidans]
MEETTNGSKARNMVKRDLKFVFSVALALTTLAACSPAENSIAAPERKVREFSEEDKRLARALSVGQAQAVTEADSPYARALLCANGMDALAERLQDFQGLAEQQQLAIEQARTYFSEELNEAGAGEGKSASDIKSDLEKTALANVDAAENARTAMACLQRLQQAG